MKILITGAGGFIGSFLVEKALGQSFETWAGVRKTTSREYLQDHRIRFKDLSFHRPELLADELAAHKAEHGAWDVIIHNLGVTKCTNISDFEKVNYQYVKHFADALIAADMVPRQFILMSSLGALGPGDEQGMTPIRRDDPATPNTAYGRSKLLAENYLRSLTDFPYVFMRPTGVYGPREKDYFLMVKSIKAGFDFGAGFKPQRITFIYVKDLVECVFRVVEKQVTRKAYIVSEPHSYSASDFRRFAQRELNKSVVIPITVPLFLLKAVSLVSEHIARLTGQPSTLNSDKYNIMKQRNWVCDITPLREELGFEPQYTLEKGVKETIRWYRENGWI